MKNLKRLTAAVLFFIISAQTCAFAYIPEGFSKLHDYDSNTYSDVYPADWYYYYVGFAYEYGIMTGNGDYTFNPGGNITLAEAVTVAARINASCYGNSINTEAVAGSSSYMSWFMPYLGYAAEQGIITPNQFSGRYEQPATREQLAYLLYRAMPSSYSKINDITPIPDVYTSNQYYTEILSLYEAGVITGNDEYGTFYAASNVQRSEVAAMVSRAVNTDLRVRFTLNPNIPYKLLTYTWTYPYRGNEFSLSMDISYYDYNYYSSKPRVYDYSVYATDEADVSGMTALAETLKGMAIDNGFTSDYDIAGFVSAFVQNIPYQDDREYKGVAEYPKYPIETLFEQGGDCEDSAALLAKLLNLLGYGAALLVSDNHMAVGLQTSGRGNISYEGKDYYYIETTKPGWRIGEVPDDVIGLYFSLLLL